MIFSLLSARAAPRGAEDIVDLTTGIGGGLAGATLGGLAALAVGTPAEITVGLMAGLAGLGAGLGVAGWPARPLPGPLWPLVGGLLGGAAGGLAWQAACPGEPRRCGMLGFSALLVGAGGGAALGALLVRPGGRGDGLSVGLGPGGLGIGWSTGF